MIHNVSWKNEQENGLGYQFIGTKQIDTLNHMQYRQEGQKKIYNDAGSRPADGRKL